MKKTLGFPSLLVGLAAYFTVIVSALANTDSTYLKLSRSFEPYGGGDSLEMRCRPAAGPGEAAMACRLTLHRNGELIAQGALGWKEGEAVLKRIDSAVWKEGPQSGSVLLRWETLVKGATRSGAIYTSDFEDNDRKNSAARIQALLDMESTLYKRLR